jgi:hypothetical protein
MRTRLPDKWWEAREFQERGWMEGEKSFQGSGVRSGEGSGLGMRFQFREFQLSRCEGAPVGGICVLIAGPFVKRMAEERRFALLVF